MDCFATLAMTWRHVGSFSRLVFARVIRISSRLYQPEGAGNAGCALHPRSRVPYAQAKEGAHEHTGERRHSDIPCAMALRLTSCSPRWGGLVVTVVGGIAPADLTPASRRQDHTTSPYAFVQSSTEQGVHRNPGPTCRDDRDTSPHLGRGARVLPLICPT